MVSVQRIPERSIRSLTRFLHAPSTGHWRWASLWPDIGLAHARAVAVEIVRDAVQGFTLGPEHPAFGNALANPLDNLTDFAKQNSQGGPVAGFGGIWEK